MLLFKFVLHLSFLLVKYWYIDQWVSQLENIFLMSNRCHRTGGDGWERQPRNRFCSLGHDWHRLRSLSGSFVLKQEPFLDIVLNIVLNLVWPVCCVYMCLLQVVSVYNSSLKQMIPEPGMKVHWLKGVPPPDIPVCGFKYDNPSCLASKQH